MEGRSECARTAPGRCAIVGYGRAVMPSPASNPTSRRCQEIKHQHGRKITCATQEIEQTAQPPGSVTRANTDLPYHPYSQSAGSKAKWVAEIPKDPVQPSRRILPATTILVRQGGNILEGGTVDLTGDDGQPKWYDLTPLIRTQHSTERMPQQKPKQSTP